MRRSIVAIMLLAALVGVFGVSSASACDGNKETQAEKSDGK